MPSKKNNKAVKKAVRKTLSKPSFKLNIDDTITEITLLCKDNNNLLNQVIDETHDVIDGMGYSDEEIIYNISELL